MPASIRLEGLAELAGALEKEWATVAAHGGEAVDKTAHKIEKTAEEIVAVRSGKTRDSIHVSGKGTFREVGPTTRYAPFIENGTYKDAPQPFMGPAADRHEDELVNDLLRLVGNL